jgi:hypothetical protein
VGASENSLATEEGRSEPTSWPNSLPAASRVGGSRPRFTSSGPLGLMSWRHSSERMARVNIPFDLVPMSFAQERHGEASRGSLARSGAENPNPSRPLQGWGGAGSPGGDRGAQPGGPVRVIGDQPGDAATSVPRRAVRAPCHAGIMAVCGLATQPLRPIRGDRGWCVAHRPAYRAALLERTRRAQVMACAEIGISGTIDNKALDASGVSM